MNSPNFPDLYALLASLTPRRYADGGLAELAPLVTGTAQTAPAGVNWYELLYGPQNWQQNNALPLDYQAQMYDPTGALMPYAMYDQISGPGAPGVGGPGGVSGGAGTSGPTSGVGHDANVQSVQQGITGLASAIGVPGIGTVASMPAVANMLGLVSSISQPGIATVDVNEPNPNINDVIANIAAQHNIAAQNPDVSIVGIGIPGVTDPTAAGTQSQSGESPGDAAGGPGASSGTSDGSGTGGGGGQSDNSLARGGRVHGKRGLVRRGALSQVR